MWFFNDEQPVAGPSSRPYVVAPKPSSLRSQRRRQATSTTTSTLLPQATTPVAASTSTSSSAGLFQGPSVTVSTSFPASSSSSTSISQSSSQQQQQQPNYNTGQSTSLSSGTISKPWSYTVTPSRTTSGVAPAQTTFVPGVVFNLTLAGADNSQAVYSVQMQMGHGGPEASSDLALPQRAARRRKRNWNGQDFQVFNFQVDLGSSDMWVAVDTCTTSDCTSAPELFNATQSLDAGSTASLKYESGSVSGEIYWDEVNIGSFGIGYQAFVGATNVQNEGLSTGNFSGLLGLGLPANSVIFSDIGGTTSSDPDGATFLDNLFGSGSSAPTQRLFSLSLERLEDVRTASTLGIGAVDNRFCPSPCSPTYNKIISQPNLGTTGYLYWRVPIDSVQATTWSNPSAGTGANTTTITLGASQVDSVKSTPLAVVDSGGVAMLVGYKPYADAMYAPYGISMSSDGYYRMPCTQQLAYTFTIGGVQIPIHPLDMTWSDPNDPSQQTCIGAIQYSSTLGQTGDFVLGSSFLKNAYSIFQYPDTNKTTQSTWQPTVGFVPLTNASVASTDFYAVRSLGKSLASVSAAQQSSVSPSGSSEPVSTAGASSSSPHSGSTAVTAAIAVSSVVGFFVIAAAAFCAWYFWLRRKFGESGMVEYSRPDGEDDKDGMVGVGAYVTQGRRDREGSGPGHYSDHSFSSSRSRKHDNTKRQKSIVDGLSDYEAEDGWGTEGTDSIRLGYLPNLAEEDGDEARAYRAADQRSFDSPGLDGIAGVGTSPLTPPARSHFSTRGTRELPNTTPLVDLSSPTTPRSTTAPATSTVPPVLPVPLPGSAAAAAAAPLPPSSSPPPSPSPPKKSRNTMPRPPKYAMSGPFPSPSRPPQLTGAIDVDYFNMLGAVPTASSGSGGATQQRGNSPQRERGRSTSGTGGMGGKKASGSSTSPRSRLRSTVLDDSLVEEPTEMNQANRGNLLH